MRVPNYLRKIYTYHIFSTECRAKIYQFALPHKLKNVFCITKDNQFPFFYMTHMAQDCNFYFFVKFEDCHFEYIF